MHIKKGQKVTFSTTEDAAGAPAAFGTHPLLAQDGDSPNPITTAFDSSTGEVTFAAAGTFGFTCGVHGAAMAGAILVSE